MPLIVAAAIAEYLVPLTSKLNSLGGKPLRVYANFLKLFLLSHPLSPIQIIISGSFTLDIAHKLCSQDFQSLQSYVANNSPGTSHKFQSSANGRCTDKNTKLLMHLMQSNTNINLDMSRF